MKSRLIALVAILIGCAALLVLAELDDEARQCLADYKVAVSGADIPADVLQVIESGDGPGSGSTLPGCSQVYALSERFFDEVPCATELIYMDEDIINDLKTDPKVGQFYQAATACAFSQYEASDMDNDGDQDDDLGDDNHQ